MLIQMGYRLPTIVESNDNVVMENASNQSDEFDQLGLYLHLAQASHRRRRPHVRDRLLVLCSVLAANAQMEKLSLYCRAEILQHNPQHMIGKWPTVGEALLDEDFLTLLQRIRSEYSIERAEQLLTSLGIEIGNERETYYSVREWAAAIMNVSSDAFVDDSEKD